ncbi:MAG: DUF1801 domain-containing protein [Candidatus Hodarchaeales archaeon]|jgi:hypothetical protein
MSELKTKKNDQSVDDFLKKGPDTSRREDCYEILQLMKDITKIEPRMWGDSIIGFGDYKYKNKSRQENEWFLIGFSPRKQNLTLYLMSGFSRFDDLMKDLGKYKTGKSCLYIKQLSDVNKDVLKEIATESVKFIKEHIANN